MQIFLRNITHQFLYCASQYGMVRLNRATTHHKSKYIYHHLPPPTTSQNISTTIHHHPLAAKYIHHHPLQSKIYPIKKVFFKENIEIFHSEVNDEKHFDQLVNNTLCQYFPTFFYKKFIYKNLQLLSDGNVRNLTSRPAIAKKRFFTRPSPLFLLYT